MSFSDLHSVFYDLNIIFVLWNAIYCDTVLLHYEPTTLESLAMEEASVVLVAKWNLVSSEFEY